MSRNSFRWNSECIYSATEYLYLNLKNGEVNFQGLSGPVEEEEAPGAMGGDSGKACDVVLEPLQESAAVSSVSGANWESRQQIGSR